MTNLNAMEPYVRRLVGLRGEAYDKELAKVLNELCPNCAEDKASVELPTGARQNDTKETGDEDKPEVFEGADKDQILSILMDHVPSEFAEAHNDIINLFYAFMEVYKAGYTGMGGVDVVVNGFNNNMIFRTLRDVMHPRFLGTYNSLVGVREFHRKKSMYDPKFWKDLEPVYAIKTIEDIMFGLSGGLVSSDFYLDVMEIGAG